MLGGLSSYAQLGRDLNQVNMFDADAQEQLDNRTVMNRDTTKNKDEDIPIGMHAWRIDSKFGDRIPVIPDTVPFKYMNSIFTSGEEGQYNTTGNQGSPRISRIFTDRPYTSQFMFTQPYDYIVPTLDQLHFTNTYSPITNLSFNECGNKQNGEDHFKALFAANFNKRLGIGFKIDYLYARGYYQNQSTSHFNGTIYSSYLGDRYDMHVAVNLNFQKVTENGGITDDYYITHPENFSSFDINEIPTVLSDNWNRNKHQHVLLSHRYKVGFTKQVPMTEQEIEAKKFAMAAQKEREEAEKRQKLAKGEEVNDVAARPDDAKVQGDMPDLPKTEIGNRRGGAATDSIQTAEAKKDTVWTKGEFVPVTSFIHTFEWNHYDRIYDAYRSPTGYYLNTYYTNYEGCGRDSVYDDTRHHNIRNTLAIAMLEGFNKYVKAGLKIFATHELRSFTLPDSVGSTNAIRNHQSFSENNFSIGAQLAKMEGSLVHFNIMAETWLIGEDKGQFRINGTGDLNFKLWNDTVQFVAKASLEHNNAPFYFRRYHGKHFWWDNDLSKEVRTHLEGEFYLGRTNTRLRVAVDNINNYTFLAQSYMIDASHNRKGVDAYVLQSDKNLSVFTAQLKQDLRYGILNWENTITFQKSTDEDIIPVPALNIYSNLYLKFQIAKVLDIRLGGDVRFFTSYYAPDYSPALGQYAVQDMQDRVKVGNYPWVNVYADFFLKHARFFLMYTHINKGGSKEYFITPHYPTNGSVLRFGISWNFFN